MSFRANTLSTFGRMSWGAHLLAYPTIIGIYVFGVKPYMENSAKKQEESEWDGHDNITRGPKSEADTRRGQFCKQEVNQRREEGYYGERDDDDSSRGSFDTVDAEEEQAIWEQSQFD